MHVTARSSLLWLGQSWCNQCTQDRKSAGCRPNIIRRCLQRVYCSGDGANDIGRGIPQFELEFLDFVRRCHCGISRTCLSNLSSFQRWQRSCNCLRYFVWYSLDPRFSNTGYLDHRSQIHALLFFGGNSGRSIWPYLFCLFIRLSSNDNCIGDGLWFIGLATP